MEKFGSRHVPMVRSSDGLAETRPATLTHVAELKGVAMSDESPGHEPMPPESGMLQERRWVTGSATALPPFVRQLMKRGGCRTVRPSIRRIAETRPSSVGPIKVPGQWSISTACRML